MSINVNVSGNPVNIRRGQMFTTDIENFKKKETQRRRKARINQVRQQSKNFADDLREVCKKDANTILSNYEKAQQATLNKLSAKKLLSLQQQYNECLENLGLAHKMAADEDTSEQILKSQTKKNKRKANERGKRATEKLYENIEKERRKNSKIKQRKSMCRQVENLRSNMVSQLNKSKVGSSKKKKKKRLGDNNKCCDCLTLPCLCPLKSATASPIQSPKTSRPHSPIISSHQQKSPPPTTSAFRSPKTSRPNSPKSFMRRSPQPSTYRPITPPQFDSRISTMIRNRKHFHDNVPPEYHPDDYQEPYLRSPLQEPSHFDIMLPTCEPPEPPNLEVTDLTEDSLPPNIYDNDNDKENIFREVSYYDHANRYSHKYTPRTRLVEKTQVPVRDYGVPNDHDRMKLYEMQRQNELIAQKRGREALKKEKLKRDHDKLLKELSQIQKNEQINKIYTRRVDGHLSEARLQEKNEKRQRNIEAAFEDVYIHKAPIITLETENSDLEDANVEGIDLPKSNQNPSVNVAEWKLPSPPRPSSPDPGPTESLRNLLERVIAQRELLRQEMSHLKLSTDTKENKDVENRTAERKVPRDKSLRKGKRYIRQTEASTSTDTLLVSKSIATSFMQSPQTSSEQEIAIININQQERRISTKNQVLVNEINDNPSTSNEPRKTSTSSVISTERKKTPQKLKNKKIQANVTVESPSTTQSSTSANKRLLAGGTKKKKSKDVEVLINKNPVEIEKHQTEPEESKEEKSNSKSTSPNEKLIEIIIKVNDKKTSFIKKPNLILNSESSSQKEPLSTIPTTEPPLYDNQSKWSAMFQKTMEVRETSTSTSYLSPPNILTVKKNSNQHLQKPLSEQNRQKTVPSKSGQLTTVKKSTKEKQKQSKQIAAPKKLDDKTKHLIEKLLALSKNSIDKLGVSSSSITTPDLDIVQTTQNIDALELTDGGDKLITELFHVPNDRESEQQTQYSNSPRRSVTSHNEADIVINNTLPSPEHGVMKEGYTALADFCTERINRLTEMIQQVREDTRKLHTLSPENITKTSYMQLPPSLNQDPTSASDYLELPGQNIPPKTTQTSETVSSRQPAPLPSAPKPPSPRKEKPRPLQNLLKNTNAVQSNVDNVTDNLFHQAMLLYSNAEPTQQTNLNCHDRPPNPSETSYNTESHHEMEKISEGTENSKHHIESIENSTENGEYPQNSTSTSEEPMKNDENSTQSRRKKQFTRQISKPPRGSLQKHLVDVDGAPGKELSTILEVSSKLFTSKFDEPGPSNRYETEVLYIDNNPKSSSTTKSSSDQVSINSSTSLKERSFITIPDDDDSQNVSSMLDHEVLKQKTDATHKQSTKTNIGRNVSDEVDITRDLIKHDESREVHSGNMLELRDQSRSTTSTSSSDSLNDILKQLGLGWAVTTLRKTKQTLELSSSSNSSSRRHVAAALSTADVNLKELLKRQHRKKITIQSSTSSTSFESVEISQTLRNRIQTQADSTHDQTLLSVQSENSVSQQREEFAGRTITGRTSTPVAQNKKYTDNVHSSTHHEQSLFTVMNHSDISIIKKLSTSESNINLSIPDVSLDIKKSLKRKIPSQKTGNSTTNSSTDS